MIKLNGDTADKHNRMNNEMFQENLKTENFHFIFLENFLSILAGSINYTSGAPFVMKGVSGGHNLISSRNYQSLQVRQLA